MSRYCGVVSIGATDCLPACGAIDGDPAVAALRDRQPPSEVFTEVAEVFRLLGDPTRVALLHALAEGGERCVCDLAAIVGVSENTVSQSMRVLRAADVVRTRRDGRRIHYRLADAHIRLLVDVTVAHVAHRDDQPSPTGPSDDD